MMIIEGPDGSGKTTLAFRLAKMMECDRIHAGGPANTSSELRGRMDFQLEFFGHILDRASVVSEQVYGPIVRGKMLISKKEMRCYEEKFIDGGWILIYCRPRIETLIEYVESDMEEEIQQSAKTYKTTDHAEKVRRHIGTITERYDEVIGSFKDRGMEVLYYVRDKSGIF
jgi:adenylate kinase family enzyme